MAQLCTFWPDLVLLHFEGCARTELLADVRGKSRVPLLVWAATWNSEDAVRVLREGADDYLGGQVAVEEVEARVVASLRRAEWGVRAQEL
jgi:two-component system KDP operon response regulator KdpE